MSQRQINEPTQPKLTKSSLKWWVKEPDWWRGKALESWENIVTDELVYIPESSVLPSTHRLKGRYVNLYAKGNIWLEIHFGINFNGYLKLGMAIMEYNKGFQWRTNMRVVEDNSKWDNKLMFVGVGEPFQDCKRVLFRGVGVPTIVRLKLFDDLLNDFRDVLDLSVERFKTVSARDISVNRKLSSIVRLFTENPSDVVKNTSHILDGVTNNCAPSSRCASIPFSPIDVAAIYRMLISDKSVRLSIRESDDFSIQFVQMFVRPLQLHAGVVQQVIHKLCDLPN